MPPLQVRWLRRAFVRAAEELSQGCLEAARRMQRSATAAGTGSAADVAGAPGSPRTPGGSSEAAAFKPLLKALSTAVYLDSGAAIGLVQEAAALYPPILRYVALVDVDAPP